MGAAARAIRFAIRFIDFNENLYKKIKLFYKKNHLFKALAITLWSLCHHSGITLPSVCGHFGVTVGITLGLF